MEPWEQVGTCALTLQTLPSSQAPVQGFVHFWLTQALSAAQSSLSEHLPAPPAATQKTEKLQKTSDSSSNLEPFHKQL